LKDSDQVLTVEHAHADDSNKQAHDDPTRDQNVERKKQVRQQRLLTALTAPIGLWTFEPLKRAHHRVVNP
jgi:hypothetical protein